MESTTPQPCQAGLNPVLVKYIECCVKDCFVEAINKSMDSNGIKNEDLATALNRPVRYIENVREWRTEPSMKVIYQMVLALHLDVEGIALRERYTEK